MTDSPLTEAQQRMIRGAHLSPPSAWIVTATGGRTGHERNAWKQNVQRLIARGLLYANAHDDYTLTAAGEALRAELNGDRP